MWSALRTRMSAHWQADRHEDKLALGVADVSFACGGRHGWMELKQADAWPARPDTVLRLPHFTTDQRLWLRTKGKAAGNTWLMLNVGDAGREWLLFSWAALDVVGTSPRAKLYDFAVLRSSRGLPAAELATLLSQQ